MGMEAKTFPQLRMLVPFLKHLWAMRLVTPPDFEAGHGSEKPGQCQALEDAMHEGIMGTELAAAGEFLELRYVGLGEQVWEVGGFFEEMSLVKVPGSYAEGAEVEYREEMVRKRRLKRVSLDQVRDVEIWKMDTQDVV